MQKTVYIAADAIVTGDVVLENGANIWHGAVLRGDSGTITVGEGTNVQDRCVLHEQTTVGKHCTIGHGAIVHGCTIGNDTLVGMGAIVLDGAVIGNGCIIGAGALVTGKTNAPDGSVLLGSPAKIIKSVTPEQLAENQSSARHYMELAQKNLPAKTE